MNFHRLFSSSNVQNQFSFCLSSENFMLKICFSWIYVGTIFRFYLGKAFLLAVTLH